MFSEILLIYLFKRTFQACSVFGMIPNFRSNFIFAPLDINNTVHLFFV